MNVMTLTNSKIVSAYRAMTPKSAERAREAREYLPSGLAHDSRHMAPYGIYVDRAKGPRKWDIDGNEYVDFYGGHGALLLGHRHPKVMAAVAAQIEKGTHFGTCHEIELSWAKLICEMIPCAERVRFTSSGTEATHMALRLARAFTGREKIIRFYGHFHGWHDQVSFGVDGHFDGSPTPGVLRSVTAGTVLVPPNDVARVEQVLKSDPDVAAVIIEPTGSNSGKVPTTPEVLRRLRELTRQYDALLIFDEVVTGFRVSPGGAQAHYNVVPDITSLAKIVAGGLPGGAVCGRKDILDWLDFEVSEELGREKVRHQGTFNANPVSAAAGAATLEIIKTTDACARANESAAWLRARMNQVLEEENVPWAVYGDFSVFHFFTNPEKLPIKPTAFDAPAQGYKVFKGDKRASMLAKLRLAMLTNGVDLKGWRGGILSATHTEAELEKTVAAWRTSLRMLKEEGEV
ncbi:MAG: aspartate aminotransferase family protein [Proteobacteria bacterium]|nr:aspartate aminotransferase family protein [Pseudomonadota bacterium]